MAPELLPTPEEVGSLSLDLLPVSYWRRNATAELDSDDVGWILPGSEEALGDDF